MLSSGEKRASLFLEGMLRKPVELTQRLQTTDGSSRSTMLATPDLLHRGLKGYHDHLSKDAATFKVPNAGSERGKERRFTPTAWNSRSIPASCLKFREICKEQMEARYAVTENAVPSAVVCIAIQLNPSLKNSSFFRSAAAAARAQVYYNCLFSDALEIVLKRRVTSGSGSPVRERAVRQRTQTDRGDLADDEDEYSMDLGAAASEQNDDDPADDGPPSEAVVRAELEAEKARFATIPMRELQAALVRNEFNVLRFFAIHKDKYPVHYEMALVIYGVVLNEANVERVFSFSSNTLHDKRTRLGATVFEAFVVVGLNFTSEVMDPELIEEILNEYYDTADTSGDHDCDDPPDDREEDQDDEPADQDPDADFELGNGGAAAAAAATDGAAGGGAAVANAIAMATPG